MKIVSTDWIRREQDRCIQRALLSVSSALERVRSTETPQTARERRDALMVAQIGCQSASAHLSEAVACDLLESFGQDLNSTYHIEAVLSREPGGEE